MRARLLLAALALLTAACGDSAEPTTTTAAPPPTTTTTAPPTTTTTAPPTTTTTAPPTTTTTAPPTTTTVPPTTTTAPPTTTTVPPTTTTVPAPALVLRGNGLGVADFGADAEQVVATLTDLLGSPTVDPGWEIASDVFCRGTVVRFPQWNDLFLLLTDAATDYAAEGTRHFAFWGAFGEGVATPSGLAPFDSTLGDLEAAVGTVEPSFDDLVGLYLIDVDVGDEAGIQFEVQDPEDPTSPILGMSAGQRDLCAE